MVHWVINVNLHREAGYDAIISQLDRQKTPYTLVQKPPFVDFLIHDDRDFGEDYKELILEIEGPVFVTGTTSTRDVSKKYGWNPGYIDAPSQTELIEVWGDHVLNSDSRVYTLHEATNLPDSFFSRPVEDTKSFSGQIFNSYEFSEWRNKILAGENDYVTLSPDDEIIVASIKKIYAEYRLFFVNGKYITGSRYKMGDRVICSSDVDEDIIRFAEERVEENPFRKALCLDIARVDGHNRIINKVIETNSISSSGFYECDMGKFVNAINEEFSK